MSANGYVNKKRQVAYTETDVLLITPKTALAEANRLLGAAPLSAATQIAAGQTARKTAIETVFDGLSKRLAITGAHEPLQLRGGRMLQVFLPNVTHSKTVFR